MYGSVRAGLQRRLLFYSHSVVSNSLRPHGLQHARIPCPSPSSGAEHWRIECFRTVVLEKTLESPLDSKEIKPVNPKGNQPWIFIGRTDAEAEAPILWPPDAKNLFIGKDPDAGKDWRQEEKGETGWDVWMASPTQWIWVWANSRRQWRTGKAGVLHSMGLQRVGHDLVMGQQHGSLWCGDSTCTCVYMCVCMHIWWQGLQQPCQWR